MQVKSEEEKVCGWSSLAERLPRLHEALGSVSASQTFQAETTHIKSLSKSRFHPPILPQPHAYMQSV